MLIVIGFLVVIVSVVGSFIALGGHLGALYQPFELTLIFGSALGAFLAGNSKKSLMLVKKALPDALKSSTTSPPRCCPWGIYVVSLRGNVLILQGLSPRSLSTTTWVSGFHLCSVV